MKAIITAALLAASGTLSAQCFQKVFAGERYFIAINQDGSLWGWGENSERQLGINSIIDQPTPVQISADQWAYISAGVNHTLGIKANGTLWAWGSDGWEKLGNGVSGNAANPQQIGVANDWKEVAAGERGSLAIKTDGTLWGWGTNNNGYLGNGAANSYEANAPVQIGTSTDWNHIAGNGRHGSAIKADGTLWAWGRNQVGQVGNGTETDQYLPVQIGAASNWLSIDAGSHNSFALRTDHTLWGWGFSSPAGLNISVAQPMQIGADSNWKTVSIKKYESSQYALLTKMNGTLWAWGDDEHEQLGNGEAVFNFGTPTQIGNDSDWVDATAGYTQSNAIKADHTVWAWGQTDIVGDGSDDVAVALQYLCSPLAVKQDKSISITLYPNPASTRLTVSGIDVKAAVAYDISGRKFHLIPQGNALDVSVLAAGLYMLKVETERGSFYGSFIKQ